MLQDVDWELTFCQIDHPVIEVSKSKSIYTVFPRINARGVYFKIIDFKFIRGGRLFEEIR